MQYGATKKEWNYFGKKLGLTEYLLPVVSDPTAEISDKSKMKSPGKTPSIYNRYGKVIGIADWTERGPATAEEIEKWSAVQNYGICIQTKLVRAFDIDVEDEALAEEITSSIDDFFGFDAECLPAKRIRENSTRCLLAFKLPGEIGKRTIRTRAGIIEFLATGQQFVAAGMHSKNGVATVRYDWEGGLENVYFPEITLEQFEILWAALVDKFAVEKPTERGLRRMGEDLDIDDPVIPLLDILSYGKDGQIHIECPWKDQHTMDSGISETSYFPKGTRGYEQGHFKCLHAHCEKRTDADFLDALGLRTHDMELLVVDEKDEEIAPRFIREKNGMIKALIHNVDEAIMATKWCERDIKVDSFKDKIIISVKGGKWRPIRDEDITELRLFLERKGFRPLAEDMIRKVVRTVALRREFDSAQEWLNSLKWDGIRRVDNFLVNYLGAKPGEYSTAVSRYMWSAMAGRVLSPGCQADMALILQGAQGVGKSTAIAALVPYPDLVAEISFSQSDDDLARSLRGKLIAELGELRGLHTKEMEAIKAFVTRKHEAWIPKYVEFEQITPRRCIFFGTTNKDQFFADETGNRRWLPFNVTKAEVAMITRDRLQLWAEAREMFLEYGVLWKDADSLCKNEHKHYMLHDTWEEKIEFWLNSAADESGEINASRDNITNTEIFSGALNMDARNISHGDDFRLVKVMRVLGWHKKVIWADGKTKRVWAKIGAVG